MTRSSLAAAALALAILAAAVPPPAAARAPDETGAPSVAEGGTQAPGEQGAPALAQEGAPALGQDGAPARGQEDAPARGQEGAPARPDFEPWYPQDIRPPAGTQYPCALRALPPGLPGIPPAEHRFIDHTYALVLRATQAKLVMLRALAGDDRPEAAWTAYLRATTDALHTLRAEPVPAGLARFRDDVGASLGLQMTFFTKALDGRRHGMTMQQAMSIPEGRQASMRLQHAWRVMSARYRGWPPETSDSIYHHLCALDLF